MPKKTPMKMIDIMEPATAIGVGDAALVDGVRMNTYTVLGGFLIIIIE